MLTESTTATITVPAVQAILDKTYGANGEGFYPMNEKVAEKILKLAETASPENVENKIMVLVWNNYSGGDTAESVAKEIVETFSL